MDDSVNAFWVRVGDVLKERISSQDWCSWFAGAGIVEIGAEHVSIDFPNDWAAGWVERHFRAVLEDAVRTAAGASLAVSIVSRETSVAGSDAPAIRSLPEQPPAPAPSSFAPTRTYASDVVQTPVSLPVHGNSLTEAELRQELGVDEARTMPLPAALEGPGQARGSAPIAPEVRRAERTAQVDRDFADTRRLNPGYTFDTFVIGATNQMAHASALAVAETPTRAYNPLFIHGPSGLGKTHLLHAIGQYVMETRPEARVAYTTAEQFVMRFTQSLTAMRTGTSTQEKYDPRDRFKEYFRGIDVLLMDDVQFFAGKGQAVLEELFHIFNELHQAGRQVVLTADCRPDRIQKLEERLQSRFAWGLIADIDSPDRETRIAILRKKAQTELVEVPYEAFESIAERVTSNVRELEGALTRVIAHASLHGHPVTLELVERVLQQYAPQEALPVTIERIQDAVCDHFALSRDELLSKRKTNAIAYPRQVAMYLSRVLCGAASTQVGAKFNRDHSTVLHAETKIEQLMKEDGEVHDVVVQLTTALRGTSEGVQHAR